MSLKSKEKIQKALLQLMETSDISEITIAEICGWSKISRGTFYNHYRTKEQVLTDISRHKIQDFCENYASLEEPSAFRLVCNAFAESRKQRDYLFLLKRQNLFHIQRDQLIDICSHHDNITKQSHFMEIPPRIQRYVILSYISSFVAIYESWAEHGFLESTQEIAEIFLFTIHYNDENQPFKTYPIN